MNDNKLIIAGSRNFNDYSLLVNKTKEYLEHHTIDIRHLRIVSGMARGADMLGVRLAKEYNIPVIEMPADWNLYGKSAGYIRNAEMAKIATHALIFWDGKSRGSGNMINLAAKYNLEIDVVMYTMTSKHIP